jgi:hypothetical protein
MRVYSYGMEALQAKVLVDLVARDFGYRNMLLRRPAL